MPMNVLPLVKKDTVPIPQQENVYHVPKMDTQLVQMKHHVLNVNTQNGSYKKKIAMKFAYQEPMVMMENVTIVMMNT